MDETATKKPNILLRLLLLLLTLAVLLGAVALVAARDRLNVDRLIRWVQYRALERSERGETEPFSYEGRADDLFADLDHNLLLLSGSAARIYSNGGTKLLELPVALTRPALSVGQSSAVLYDIGGTQLRVLSGREEAFSLSMEEKGTLLSASLNQNDWLAVTTRESGYKGVATVYDAGCDTVMAVRLSSRFLMDAVVTGDNRSLVAVALGQEDGMFQSTLLFYALDGSETPYASCPLPNDVVLALRSGGDGVWAVGETGLSIFSNAGAPLGAYDFEGRHLRDANLHGDGFAALLLGKYRVGSAAELVTVGPDGGLLGALPLSEQVLSLSAAGRYLAVLTADRLDIYTRDLTPYATLEGTRSARNVVLRSDGSAFLVGSETAQLYIPG